jgi:hypothetical protein
MDIFVIPWLQNNKKTRDKCFVLKIKNFSPLLCSHKSQLHRFLYSQIASSFHLFFFSIIPSRRTLNRYTLVQPQSTSKPRSFVSAQHLHLRQTLNLVILSILGTEIVTVTTLISPHFLYFT